MLQCIYYAALFNDLWLYKHSFVNRNQDQLEELAAERLAKGGAVSLRDLQGADDLPPFRIGIIGCGQIGTCILTKLLEVKDQLHNMKIQVSTRQPHLLRSFQQEFGVDILFDN